MMQAEESDSGKVSSCDRADTDSLMKKEFGDLMEQKERRDTLESPLVQRANMAQEKAEEEITVDVSSSQEEKEAGIEIRNFESVPQNQGDYQLEESSHSHVRVDEGLSVEKRLDERLTDEKKSLQNSTEQDLHLDDVLTQAADQQDALASDKYNVVENDNENDAIQQQVQTPAKTLPANDSIAEKSIFIESNINPNGINSSNTPASNTITIANNARIELLQQHKQRALAFLHHPRVQSIPLQQRMEYLQTMVNKSKNNNNENDDGFDLSKAELEEVQKMYMACQSTKQHAHNDSDADEEKKEEVDADNVLVKPQDNPHDSTRTATAQLLKSSIPQGENIHALYETQQDLNRKTPVETTTNYATSASSMTKLRSQPLKTQTTSTSSVLPAVESSTPSKVRVANVTEECELEEPYVHSQQGATSRDSFQNASDTPPDAPKPLSGQGSRFRQNINSNQQYNNSDTTHRYALHPLPPFAPFYGYNNHLPPPHVAPPPPPPAFYNPYPPPMSHPYYTPSLPPPPSIHRAPFPPPPAKFDDVSLPMHSEENYKHNDKSLPPYRDFSHSRQEGQMPSEERNVHRQQTIHTQSFTNPDKTAPPPLSSHDNNTNIPITNDMAERPTTPVATPATVDMASSTSSLVITATTAAVAGWGVGTVATAAWRWLNGGDFVLLPPPTILDSQEDSVGHSLVREESAAAAGRKGEGEEDEEEGRVNATMEQSIGHDPQAPREVSVLVDHSHSYTDNEEEGDEEEEGMLAKRDASASASTAPTTTTSPSHLFQKEEEEEEDHFLVSEEEHEELYPQRHRNYARRSKTNPSQSHQGSAAAERDLTNQIQDLSCAIRELCHEHQAYSQRQVEAQRMQEGREITTSAMSLLLGGAAGGVKINNNSSNNTGSSVGSTTLPPHQATQDKEKEASPVVSADVLPLVEELKVEVRDLQQMLLLKPQTQSQPQEEKSRDTEETKMEELSRASQKLEKMLSALHSMEYHVTGGTKLQMSSLDISGENMRENEGKDSEAIQLQPPMQPLSNEHGTHTPKQAKTGTNTMKDRQGKHCHNQTPNQNQDSDDQDQQPRSTKEGEAKVRLSPVNEGPNEEVSPPLSPKDAPLPLQLPNMSVENGPVVRLKEMHGADIVQHENPRFVEMGASQGKKPTTDQSGLGGETVNGNTDPESAFMKNALQVKPSLLDNLSPAKSPALSKAMQTLLQENLTGHTTTPSNTIDKDKKLASLTKLASGLRMIHMYLSNILKHPHVPRYRKVHLLNPSYTKSVAPLVGAKELLLAVGFVEQPSGAQILEWPTKAVAVSCLGNQAASTVQGRDRDDNEEEDNLGNLQEAKEWLVLLMKEVEQQRQQQQNQVDNASPAAVANALGHGQKPIPAATTASGSSTAAPPACFNYRAAPNTAASTAASSSAPSESQSHHRRLVTPIQPIQFNGAFPGRSPSPGSFIISPPVTSKKTAMVDGVFTAANAAATAAEARRDGQQLSRDREEGVDGDKEVPSDRETFMASNAIEEQGKSMTK